MIEEDDDAPLPDDEDDEEESEQPGGDDEAPEPEADAADEEEAEDSEAAEKPAPDQKRTKRRERDKRRWSNLTRRLREQEAELQRLRQQPQVPPEHEVAVLDKHVEVLEAKYADAARRYQEAREQMDSKQEVEILREMQKLSFDLQSTEIVRDGKKAAPQQHRQQPQAPQQAPDPQSRLNKWAGDVKFLEWARYEQQIAEGIDQTLVSEGYDRNDDDFYEELEARLSAALPARRAAISATRPKPAEPSPKTRKPEKIVVRRASVPSSGNDAGAGGASIPTKLPGWAIKEMEKINLHPDDPDDVALYATALRNNGRI